MADAMQEQQQWAGELPGDGPPFHMAAMGISRRGMVPTGTISTFLCTADGPSHVCHCCIPHISDMV